MQNTLVEAINTRAILQLRYKGVVRVVEPHAYGINEPGHEVLSCYQISGGSNSSRSSPWKLLLIDEILDLTVTQENFSGARPEYVRNSKSFTRIFAQL